MLEVVEEENEQEEVEEMEVGEEALVRGIDKDVGHVEETEDDEVVD